ncbi:SGNH/GDSL hydrolase family protein [Roseimaritima ulvae]|uniref:SGNH hydrolase-type esterase domain-containing protein n=1 Tax=Roseimaritima ulvae TaxID=980254 RepID=A0A5B9QNM0_9BACT|nr:SGNH/GDSL hydrolase family protein [Roseimaritima ulvae]QEG40618.1 hypothetical protein UC8_26350 [Roseimaritima ulvae]
MSAQARSHRSARFRKLAFRSAAVALGLVPFVLLEVALRQLPAPRELVATPPPAESQPGAVPVEAYDPDPLVDLHQLRPLFTLSDSADVWEIPTSRRNFFQPAQFARHKPANGRRIFVVGGSTVQGRPYSTETAFAELLRVQCQTAWPQFEWEIVNCGGVSYAAYRVAAIVDEVLQHEPDAVVVYTGHNEFLEARTYAVQRRIPPSLAPWLAAGCRLRIVQWPATWLRSPPPQRSVLGGEVDAVLDHPGGLELFEREPEFRTCVIDHFQLSLCRIAEACRAAEVPLVFCVPASDVLSVPPFKSAPPSAEEAPAAVAQQVQQSWRQATDPQRSSEQRVEACRQVLKLDPLHAGAAYMWGRQLWQREDYDEAATWLLVARDRDVCPLRATSEIEARVRQAAERYGTMLVDVPGSFASPQQSSICQVRRFVDHVHPRIDGGHTRIADALFQQLAASPALALPPAECGSDQRAAAVDAYLAGFDVSYFERGNQRLEGLRRWAAGRGGDPLTP